MGKTALQQILRGLFLLLAFPLALLSMVGRIEAVLRFLAQMSPLGPGLPGDYFRVAYYKLTLESCSLESRIQFGSFFAHRQARVGRMVYVGCNCVLGRVAIGDRTQIASAVQVLSGRRQYARDSEGRLLGSCADGFHRVNIGQDCWIGAGAIVMEDVGNQATVGAGSVITKVVPAGSVVVGSPARPVKEGQPQDSRSSQA